MSPRAWLLAACAALFALHVALLWPAHGFVLSDTTGYLANARWLAGEAGSTWQGPSPFYHPGWSLLVAPLYVLFDSPRTVQVGALLLNAGLATAVLPAAYLVARRAFALPAGIGLASAAVAATYPAVVLLAGYEWGESLYQLLFAGFVVAVAAVLRRPTPARAMAVGLTAAALNATHPRGLGVVVVAGAFLVVLAARRRLPGNAALAGLAALLVAFAATRLLDRALLDAIYGERSAAVEGDVLGRLTEPRLLWGAAKATLGQLWYLSVASFGAVPLGALWLATSRRLPRTVAVVTLAAAGTTLAASALFMSDGTRVDHMVYGRYLEGVVPVLLVAGGAAIAAWRSRLAPLLGTVAVGTAGAAALLVAVRGGAAFTGDVMPLNVTGVLVFRQDASQLDVARVTVAALVVMAVVLLAARRQTVIGLAVLAGLFAGSAGTVQADTLDPFDRFWAGTTRIPEIVRLVSDGGAVSYDRGSYVMEAANFYQVELADRGLRFTDGTPSTDLVIASPRWNEPGARLVFVEAGPYAEQALWVMPGRLQRRLDADGRLLPTQFSAVLPTAARRQAIEADPPSSMGPGAVRTVPVTVTHAGGGAAWAPLDVLAGVVDGTVRLAARWYDGTGTEVASQTADLDRVLLPGQSTTVDLALQAPATAGRYTVAIGLRQEGKVWFPDPRRFTVDVR